MGFWSELRRRNVARVAAAYIVTAWLTIQAADVLVPALRLPPWMESAVVFVLILGFPIALLFSWAYELTPDGLKRESEIDRSESITQVTGRKLDFLIIGLLAVALVYFTFDKFVISPHRTADLVATKTEEVAESVRREVESAADAIDESSIAVLPFVNMSADPEQEYFSDGLSEELLNTLAQFKELRVAARTSSFQFKGQNQDISEIGRALKVAHVLEGSVRKSGDRLRITAQLIKADDGYHLWSHTYDRKLTDVFDIQVEIAKAITASLHEHLGSNVAADTILKPLVVVTGNPQAYDAYLKGRQLINRRGKENIEAGARALERALRLDADFAPAHAQLSIATTLLLRSPASYGDLALAEVVERATPHIERAFELEPELAEAHGAMALLSINRGSPFAAIEHGERAVRINPSYIDAWSWLSSAYEILGRHTDVVRVRTEIYQRDPRSVIGRMNYVNMMAAIGKFDEAERVGVALAEEHPWAGLTALEAVAIEIRGELAQGIALGLRAYAHEPDDLFTNMFLARAFGWMGLPEEALRIDDDVVFDALLSGGRHREAVGIVRARIAVDDQNPESRHKLALALYRLGQLDESRVQFEDLLARLAPAEVLVDPYGLNSYPTLRLAHLRRLADDESGAELALASTEADLETRRSAGMQEYATVVSAAMIFALRHQRSAAIEHLGRAIDIGLRDPHLLDEPIFTELQADPGMREIKARLQNILADERARTLALICSNNPAPDAWQPLARTCSEE